MASILECVTKKVQQHERVTRQDALELFATPDLIGLGRIADQVKRVRWQNHAHFVINRQINPTNICVLSCRFCDFGTKRRRPNAYEMTIEEVVGRCNAELREVHIVGGLHPDWTWDYYLEMMRAIKANAPQIQIKAWTAVEIDYFSKKFRLSVSEVLRQLQAAGLSALPGGGAEVFSERVRKALFPFKIGASRWLEIHKTAHQLGIPTNATLLYGHMETLEERIDHMLMLRALQDETNGFTPPHGAGFMSFIPLAYQPGKTQVVSRQASAIDQLKTLAIARLVLDNVPHLKAYWVTMGAATASVALRFGADDIDGTIGEERVMHAADAASPVSLTRSRLVEMIQESGCIPVERDALYRTIQVYEASSRPAPGQVGSGDSLKSVSNEAT